MSEDEVGACRKNTEAATARNGEPTQRFSALQQQLLCATINFFHRHIRSDPDVLQRMDGNQMFRLFFEVQYHSNKPDLNRIFPESVHDCSALHVCSFILSILHQGIFSVSAFIVSVIYLSRFKESSHITLHACTWRPLFLTSLLLADKMWEDKPVRNSSLAKLFPVLNNAELNKMESEFLVEIKFNVNVKPDLFCSFCEKLLAEQVHAEISHCVNTSEYAATLQADNPEVMPAKPSMKQVHEVPQNTDILNEASNTVNNAGGFADNPDTNSGRLAQPQVAWMEAGTTAPTGNSAMAAPGHPEVMAPRSHSAGPTTGTGARRAETARVGSNNPNLHSLVSRQQGADGARGRAMPRADGEPMRNSMGPSSGVGTKPSSTPQPPRSVTVHPLHRNESTKKHSANKAEDVPDKVGRTGHHPQAQNHSHNHNHNHNHSGPSFRRSFPSKTSGSAYAPLARAPSSGGGSAGIGRDNGSASSGPSTSSIAAGGASANAAPGHPEQQVTSAARSGSVGTASTGGARPPAQSSPRSPGDVSPVLVPHEQQRSHQPQQQQQGQQQSQQPQHQHQQRQSRQGHGTGQAGHGPQTSQQAQHLRANPQRGVATPPVPVGPYSTPSGQGAPMSKMQQSRGSSPGSGHPSCGGGVQPARASSAPRVTGMAAHHATPSSGSTVRTASQPMQATSHHSRQQGSVSPVVSQHYGHASPMGRTMPLNMGRSSIGSTSGLQRNVSPMGVATPSSPAGGMCMGGQLAFGNSSSTNGHRVDVLSTTRGRSPPPTLSGPNSGPTTVRAPRAVTPGALVKGLAQHVHASGGVTRSSIGGSSMVVHARG